MKIIKQTREVGTSAGVLLPREWLNKQVVVQIINPDIKSIKKRVFEILIEEDILQEVFGIYLVGSYARQEQTYESDIDILVITSNTNKRFKKDFYEITLISEKNLKKQLDENILPILPWLIESKAIINESLIQKYKNTKLTKNNLKWHIDTTKSAMNVVKEDIKLSEEFPEIKMMNSSAYSLILRLRTIYIIECLKKGKLWKKKEFLNLIKNISGSLNTYEIYNEVKNKNKSNLNLSVKEAKKLINYINEKINEIEKWAKGKKD